MVNLGLQRMVFDLDTPTAVTGLELWKHKDAGTNGLRAFGFEQSRDGESWAEIGAFTSERDPAGHRYERFALPCAARHPSCLPTLRLHSRY